MRHTKSIRLTALAICSAALVGAADAAAISVTKIHEFSNSYGPDPLTITNATLGNLDATAYDKLVVAFSSEKSGVTSIQYGGAPFLEAVYLNLFRETGVYYLDNPSVNGSFVFDRAGGNGMGGVIFGLKNTAPGYGATSATGNTNTVSLTTTAADSVVVASAVVNGPPSTFTVSSGSLTPLAESIDAGSAGHASAYLQVASSGTNLSIGSAFNPGPTTADDGIAAVEFLAVPEPTSIAMLVVGGLIGLRRRR